MALSNRLVMRQGQALVMTPQLLQAIKLLQLSNLELVSYLQEEVERNPLLETEETTGAIEAGEEPPPAVAENEGPQEADWAQDSLAVDRAELAADLGADLSNAFEPEGPGVSANSSEEASDPTGLSATSWTGPGGGGGGEEAPDIEAYLAASESLHEHLSKQLPLAFPDARRRFIGQVIVGAVDELGYLREPIEEIASRLGVSLDEVEAVLAAVQRFDPSGVAARDLAECLAIQLRERDRYDPAMQIFVANLPLVAKRDFAQLARLCGVDEDDLRDMAAELRALDPKPGRAFGGETAPAVVADVIVRAANDGSWLVELNTEALPRVLMNNTYAARIGALAKGDKDKSYIATCAQSANWLIKSLEQRQRTILKVSSEIVRFQDGFFAKGVEYLRPLNLRTIADTIGMHESTVSRVTSNKYMMTPRGLFELKYFFSASIATTTGEEAHSAEAVRYKIKQMIESENPEEILSDDAIVAGLRRQGVEIARRTVAKYRESLNIPSSVERRRLKAHSMRPRGQPSGKARYSGGR